MINGHICKYKHRQKTRKIYYPRFGVVHLLQGRRWHIRQSSRERCSWGDILMTMTMKNDNEE